MKNTYSIGVDLGGTNLRIASYAEGTDFIDSVLLPSRIADGRDCVVRDMCEAIKGLAAKRYRGLHLGGIGVGMPGPLELPEGIARNPPNLSGWDGFNIRHAIESTLGSHIEIESDANVAALAETLLGSGSRHSINSLCFLTLGTGVGSGLILDGEIWHGSTGMGGEAGHLVIEDTEGAPCGCSGSGCLEQYASATVIVRMARERIEGTTSIDSHEVALLAREGHPQAISVFEAVGHALAIGFTDLINCLNLPLYLVGGGVSEAWDLFSPFVFRELELRSYVYRLTRPEAINPEQLERHKTYILKAQLGSAAGLLGACLLPLQQHINSGDLKGRLLD